MVVSLGLDHDQVCDLGNAYSIVQYSAPGIKLVVDIGKIIM